MQYANVPSSQQPVFKGGSKKPANVPDHEPPQGYICYRCGEKGHWIQLCPTNDNPEYDNRPRVKRTTGIPKSFLKTVDKATALAQHGEGDDSKTPSGIMVNADGEFVIAEPDKASWEQFQAKAKTTAAAQKVASEEDKEMQDLGLECPIDKRMFIDPMKTPCCEKTYCNDCITNALIESDFVCPGCQTEGVLIDDLKPDDEAVTKAKDYLTQKDTKAKEASKSAAAAASPKSPAVEEPKPAEAKAEEAKPKSPLPASTQAPSPTTQTSQISTTPGPTSTSTPTSGDSNPKKRPAEDSAENPKIPKAPKAMQKAQEAQNQQAMMQMMNGVPMNPMNVMPGMPNMPNMANMPNMPNMPFGGMPMNGFGGMGMNNMNMGMGMGMMNPMMNPMMGGMPGFNPNNMNGGFPAMGGNNMWGGDMSGVGMNGGGMNGGMNGGGMNGVGMNGGMGGGSMNMNMNGGGMPGMIPQAGFNPHQQQQMPFRNFSNQPADDEDAYFRKPVNPHRHQNRQRRVRPSDYREL